MQYFHKDSEIPTESETRRLGQYMIKCRSVNASDDIETALRYHRFSQIRMIDKKMREANGERKREKQSNCKIRCLQLRLNHTHKK